MKSNALFKEREFARGCFFFSILLIAIYYIQRRELDLGAVLFGLESAALYFIFRERPIEPEFLNGLIGPAPITVIVVPFIFLLVGTMWLQPSPAFWLVIGLSLIYILLGLFVAWGKWKIQRR